MLAGESSSYATILAYALHAGLVIDDFPTSILSIMSVRRAVAEAASEFRRARRHSSLIGVLR
jgi:hypothetical protein